MFAPVIIARLIAKAKGGVFGGSSRGACTWVAAPPPRLLDVWYSGGHE